MSETTWLSTVGVTTADQLACITFRVASYVAVNEDKRDIALGVSFAAAFVFGGLIALIASVLIFRYLAKKESAMSSSTASESNDAESKDLTTAAASYQRLKRESDVSSAGGQWNSELKSPDTFISEKLKISLFLTPTDVGHGVCDALLLPSYAESLTALLRISMLEITDLERNLTEEKINIKKLCVWKILAPQLKRGRISKFQHDEILKKFHASVNGMLLNTQKDYALKTEEVKKFLKESDLIEIEMAKQYLMHFFRLVLAAEKADEIFLSSLSAVSNLSPDEVRDAVQHFRENITRLETRLSEDGLQQSVFLDELQMNRRRAVEILELYKQSFLAEVIGRENMFSKSMQSLSSESKVSEKVRSELLGRFGDALRSLHHTLNLELHEMCSRGLKLQQTHREKLSQLTEVQQKHRGSFASSLRRMASNNDTAAETYMELMTKMRQEMNELKEELEQEDAETVENICREYELLCQKGLKEVDDQLMDSLRSQKGLSERDTSSLRKQYLSLLQQEQKMINLEKREKLRQMAEKFSPEQTMMRKWQWLKTEDMELKERQEKLLLRVFRTQTLLSSEARRLVLRYHKEDMTRVGNQLLIANLRHETVETWLQHLRRQMTSREPTEASDKTAVTSKDKKAKKQTKKTQKQQKESDATRLDRTLAEVEEYIMKEGYRHEDEILGCHEIRIAQLIGHQVAGEARKRALVRIKQNDTMNKLEKLVVRELDGRSDEEGLPDKYFDVVLQQHLTEISEMLEEMRLARSRQEELIYQKVESKQHTKERDIASEFNGRSRKQWEENNNVVAEHFEQIGFQRLFQEALSDLKLDSMLETEKLREEVSSELESELHQQLMEERKVFLAQVMMLTKMTKDKIEELITAAVQEAGGDDKDVQKLSKDFMLEVQKAKINSGLERQPPKPKSTDHLHSFDQSLSPKTNRSKTDLGNTYPKSSQEMLRREKTSFQGYKNRSYLESDDDISSGLRGSLPQRPQSALRKSVEI